MTVSSLPAWFISILGCAGLLPGAELTNARSGWEVPAARAPCVICCHRRIERLPFLPLRGYRQRSSISMSE